MGVEVTYVNGIPLRGHARWKVNREKKWRQSGFTVRHTSSFCITFRSKTAEKCDIPIIIVPTLRKIYFKVQGTSEYFLLG